MVSPPHRQTQVWPFLVGRGRRQGYRTLLAPSFLVEHDMHESLSDATPSVPAGILGRANVRCAGPGSLALTYTTEGISNRNIKSTDGAQEWTDEHGRPLEMLYGVVSREPLSDTLAISHLRQAREDARDAYRRFLTHEDDFSVRVSRPYSLPRQMPDRRDGDVIAPLESGHQRRNPRPDDRQHANLGSPPAARPHRQADGALALDDRDRIPSTAVRRHPAQRIPLRHHARRAITLVALVVVIAAAGVWLLGGGSTSSNLKIIDASARPAHSDTCDQTTQVTLHASLSANHRLRVRYRWLPTRKIGAANASTDETVTIPRTSANIADVRPASAAPYKLIIDRPVSLQSGPVTCRSSEVSASPSNAAGLTLPGLGLADR